MTSNRSPLGVHVVRDGDVVNVKCPECGAEFRAMAVTLGPGVQLRAILRCDNGHRWNAEFDGKEAER